MCDAIVVICDYTDYTDYTDYADYADYTDYTDYTYSVGFYYMSNACGRLFGAWRRAARRR